MRNASIELYRIILMLGIVGLHAHGILKPFGRGLDGVCATCVVGFVFISGWFGIKFSWKKVRKLLLIGLYCGLVTALLHCAVLSGFTWHGFVRIYWWNMKCYWFLWAYIALMMLAPLLDRLFACGRVDRATVMPILVLVFGWSYLTKMPKFGEFVPSVLGFGPTSMVTFLAIYVFARVVRINEIDAKIKKWQLAFIGIIGFAGSWIGFAHYNSPFALALPFATFVCFKGLYVSPGIGRLCSWLAPSMFSVYLLHTTGVGFCLIRVFGQNCPGNAAVAYVITVLLTFGACVVLDLPRRIIMQRRFK